MGTCTTTRLLRTSIMQTSKTSLHTIEECKPYWLLIQGRQIQWQMWRDGASITKSIATCTYVTCVQRHAFRLVTAFLSYWHHLPSCRRRATFCFLRILSSPSGHTWQ